MKEKLIPGSSSFVTRSGWWRLLEGLVGFLVLAGCGLLWMSVWNGSHSQASTSGSSLTITASQRIESAKQPSVSLKERNAVQKILQGLIDESKSAVEEDDDPL